MIRMHPRNPIIGRIRSAVSEAINTKLREDPSITYGELCAALAEEMRIWAGFQVADERFDSIDAGRPCAKCGNPKEMHRAESDAHHSECTLEQFTRSL